MLGAVRQCSQSERLKSKTQMRKRSKYRPKPVLLNPVGHVLEGMTPLSKYRNYMLDLKIKNHAALASLTQGRATYTDIDALIQMVNMTEACYRLGIGKEYNELVVAGLAALRSVGRRGHETGKFILRAEEMRALNDIMELHDAQLETLTIKDLEKAVNIVKEEYRLKKATPINAKENPNG
jgi:hypothetical protein